MAYIRIGEKTWTVPGDKTDIASDLGSGHWFSGELENEPGTIMLITPSLAWAEFRDAATPGRPVRG
jgi:hypothetical protein